MTCLNRFTHALTFAALAIFLLPQLHTQTANNTKPANHSGNMQGNHKDIMGAASVPGDRGSSQQGSEVRTEKLNYKQKVTGTQAKPVDDTDPARHHPTATAANPQGTNSSGSNTTAAGSSSGTATPQAAQDNVKFKQEFGPTQANKKN